MLCEYKIPTRRNLLRNEISNQNRNPDYPLLPRCHSALCVLTTLTMERWKVLALFWWLRRQCPTLTILTTIFQKKNQWSKWLLGLTSSGWHYIKLKKLKGLMVHLWRQVRCRRQCRGQLWGQDTDIGWHHLCLTALKAFPGVSPEHRILPLKWSRIT